MARDMSQSVARLIRSAYLPSRMVLPSMRRAMPDTDVITMGYCPADSQWPSRFWLSQSHFKPLLIHALYSAGISSARTDGTATTDAPRPHSSDVMNNRRFMEPWLLERNVAVERSLRPLPSYEDDQ